MQSLRWCKALLLHCNLRTCFCRDCPSSSPFLAVFNIAKAFSGDWPLVSIVLKRITYQQDDDVCCLHKAGPPLQIVQLNMWSCRLQWRSRRSSQRVWQRLASWSSRPWSQILSQTTRSRMLWTRSILPNGSGKHLSSKSYVVIYLCIILTCIEVHGGTLYYMFPSRQLSGECWSIFVLEIVSRKITLFPLVSLRQFLPIANYLMSWAFCNTLIEGSHSFSVTW